MLGTTESNRRGSFSETRKTPRFVPKTALTVAILSDGIPFAYGVVNNISEGGACLQTGGVPLSRAFDLVLSFPNGELVEANGRLVWARFTEDESRNELYGVEFTQLADPKRRQLKTALESSAFTAC